MRYLVGASIDAIIRSVHQERLLNRRFYKSASFRRRTMELDAWDQVDELKKKLDLDPMAGDVIKGTNGLRKIRIPLPGRGSLGGGRVIYFQVVEPASILLLGLYAKNVQEDLNEEQKQVIIRLRQGMCRELGLSI